MTIHCFTSITNNYLPKARILGNTLKRHHPDWIFHVVLSDPVDPDIELIAEPFDDFISIESLGIGDFEKWVFFHSVTELCTAVKGPAGYQLLQNEDVQNLIYLDPDIVVFNNLQAIVDRLGEYSILLTPHQNKYSQDRQTIINDEISSLRHGVFNLGFLAIHRDDTGLEFMEWYRNRLMDFCFDDIPFGLFTDQRWCDLAPCFFDGVNILRQSEVNVATWNLSHRTISMRPDGMILADGRPLLFYHFSGYDSGAGKSMARYLLPDRNHIVHEIWSWYERQLIRYGQDEWGSRKWAYGFFNNGEPITREMRNVYRSRNDLQTAFPNPFETRRSDGGFHRWWHVQYLPHEKAGTEPPGH